MDEQDTVLEGELVNDATAERSFVPEAIQVQDDLFAQELSEQRNALVYKRNELIHGQFNMRTLALKTFSAVLAQLDPRSNEFPPVNFTRTELARLVKVSRQAMFQLVDDLTNELQSVVVKVPYIDKDWEDSVRAERSAAKREGRPERPIPRPKADDSFVKVNLFQKAIYNAEANLITFVFNERLKDYLVDLRGNFTYYQLNSVISMSSGHAIRMYEILRAALSLKAVESGVLVAYKDIDYQELRDMLAIAPEAYPRFSLFERDLLRRVQKQMEGGDLTFTYSLPDRIGPGRKRAPVKTIRFRIMATMVPSSSGDWKLTLVQTFTQAARTKLKNSFTEARLQRNVEYYHDQLVDGLKVTRASSWLRKAFSEDYAGIAQLKSGVHVREAMQADFLRDQLLKLWLTLPAEDQDSFLTNGFECESIDMMYQLYRTLRVKKDSESAGAKQTARSKREAVTEAVMDIKDVDW